VVRDGDEVVARCTLRSAHEGAPTRSHGGIVAAMFDDVYGFVLTIMRQPAFTGELSVRYVAGTPIGVPLECRVRLAEQVGRKLYMTGELTAAGSVVATSKATFIAIDPSVFEQVSRSGTGG
jgi:acyl-coenzyme A thioesterase PaaI-like protein